MKILDEGYYDLILNKTLAPNYADGDSITYINQRHSLIHITVFDKGIIINHNKNRANLH